MAELTEKQNVRLRKAMQKVIDEKFHGHAATFATAIGRAAPGIWSFLHKKGGASLETAKLFAAHIHEDVYSIIGHDEDTVLTYPIRRTPKFKDVLRDAKKLLEGLPDDIWEEASHYCTPYKDVRASELANLAQQVANRRLTQITEQNHRDSGSHPRMKKL